jgi:hypothetical protein
MTEEALVREDRADMPVEVDALRGLGHKRRDDDSQRQH